MEKVSVIIPIYNVEKYLRESIDSVINQTYKNLEIILVDDESQDNCGAICEEYAKKDDRIKVIHKKNGGLSDARNKGLEIATGEYIMFLDSDDFFEINACEVLYNEISSKKADMVTANYIQVDDDGTKWEKPIFDVNKFRNFEISINDFGDSFYVMNSPVCNKIFRKKFLDEINVKFQFGLPAEDAMFTMYCFIRAKKVYYIQDIIFNYRQRNNKTSISNNCSLEYFKGISKAYKILYDDFKSNNKLAYYRYFYAKSLSYMLYKFIDSDVMEYDEKIESLKTMRWFYKLSEELEIPTCQRSMMLIVDSIINERYDEAINYCKIIKEVRQFVPKELRGSMSKPDSKMYSEISKLDYKFEEGKKMFKLKFKNTYDAAVFSKYGLKESQEDYYSVKDNIFCVADGITRDLTDGTIINFPQNEEELKYLISKYPNPSGALLASKIFCKSVVNELSKYKKNEISEELLIKVMKKANKDIWEINKDRNIDYVKEDLYGTVAVGGVIIDNVLYCFSIGDCHISLLNDNLDIVFTTFNEHKQNEDYLNNIYIPKYGFDWSNPECRRMVRRDYRNRPEMKYKGNDISFGALTGEMEAEYYFKTYKVDLSNVKYVCAYSDGCEPNFENKENIKKVIENPESIKERGMEKTLIIYEKIGRG